MKNFFKMFAVILVISLLTQSAIAQGVFAGTKKAPLPVAWGWVYKITEKGPPLKLEATKLQVKFSDIYDEAESVANSGGLFKPTSGEVQTIIIGDFKVELASKDFSKGFLDTKDFGKIALFVIPSITSSDSWILAVTDEQLKKIQAKVKNNDVK